MLDNTLTVNYGATAVTLTRVNQDNFESTYFGTDGPRNLTLNIKHDKKPRGVPGSSHLVRLDVEHYDADGVYIRTSSAWEVIKTFDGSQDDTACQDTVAALQDFTAVAGNTAKIVLWES